MPHHWMIGVTIIEVLLNGIALAGAVRLGLRYRNSDARGNLLMLCLMFGCMTVSNVQWCLQILSDAPPPRAFYMLGKVCAPLDYLFFAIFIWRRHVGHERWHLGKWLSWLLPFGCCLAAIVQYTIVPFQAQVHIDTFSRVINFIIWPLAALLMSLLLRFSQQTMRAIDTVFLLSMMLILTSALAGEYRLVTVGYTSASWEQAGWIAGFAGLAGCVWADVGSRHPVLHKPAEKASWFSLRALVGVSVFVSNMALLASLRWAGLLSVENGNELTRALLLGFAFWCASIWVAIVLSRKIQETRALMCNSLTCDGPSLQVVPQQTLLTEVDGIVAAYNGRLAHIHDLNRKLAEQEKQAALGHAARQVAHDIRSPLAALKMVLPYVDRVEEEIRVLLRDAVHRVEDIANELLEHNRRERTSSRDKYVLVSAAVEPLISQLRVVHRARLGLTIQCHIEDDACFLCATAPASDFQRVVSNLVTNAAEAIGETGVVDVAVRRNGKAMEVAIRDTGKGMPPALLARLGEEGMTHGKENGNGLGVFQARREICKWGGNLAFESVVGQGTSAIITLPLTDSPRWLQTELRLDAGQRVIVVDDDVSIHRVWRERFGDGAMVTSCSTVKNFLQAARSVPDGDEPLYLVDYELNGSDMNGLAAIGEAGLTSAILVTSNYDDAQVIAACEAAGVHVLPKFLAARVPIKREVKQAQRAAG